MMSRLPFEIREAVVQAFGKAFWLKDPFKGFLLSSGISPELYDRYANESKYKIARHILAELDSKGEEGWTVQRRIVTELCKLRNVPDEAVPDRDAALNALRSLKELARTQKLYVEEEQASGAQRAQDARRKQAALAARAQKMSELRQVFLGLISKPDQPQSRGYGFEELLAELFAVHEISYRPPYRTETEQIDGHFEYLSFHYLVEARWRLGPPAESDLAALKRKVEKKLASTRGLFLSIAGYRTEVVLQATSGTSSNIILVDGADLNLILEGHISLTDALDLKIQKAAQEGIIYFPLAQRFG